MVPSLNDGTILYYYNYSIRISFPQYNNPYNHEKFIKICGEYGVNNDLTKWRNQKYFSRWQSRDWETGKRGLSYIMKIHSPDGLLRNWMV